MSFFDEIRDQIGAAPEGAPSAPTPDAAPAAPRSASPSVGEFVAQVAPAAIEAGRRLGVDPSILIGQWGLETGWGKSVIPGTNNLGNIKDFSGNGIAATDNMTGSRDRYRQYASINDFGSDYADLIERRYGSAIGAGQDAARYAEALKAGGYAEDPAYVEKMARAAEMVRGAGVGLGEGWNGAPAGATQQGGAVSLEPDSFLASGFEALEQRDRQEASDESPMSTNLSRGWRQMSDSLGNYISLLEGDEAAIVERLQEAQKFDAENPMPTATAKFYQDWTDENYLTAMINAPGFAGGMVEQLANSLPSMIGSIPSMIAGGVAGAAAGPVGVLLGASAGGALGSAPGSVALETGARISAMAGKAGVDVSNPAAFQAWLTENRDAILAEGMSKGLTVAAFDGIAGGVGSAIIARPALRLQQAERRILERMGVNGADEFAVAAARRTPQYQTALKPFKAEFEVANTAGANAMRGFASFAAESMGEFGGEYAGEVAATGEGNFNEALLEGVMGAGQSAITTGAQFAAKKIMQPNSPLTNAANMATASTPAAPGTAPGAPAATAAGTTAGLGQPGAAAPGTPGAAPGTDLVATDALSDDAARLQRIQSFAEDKAFLSALRSNPAYGKESASDFLSAYAKARNPNIDPLVRARAMDDIESFIRDFENRPNFTMGGAQAEQGGDQQQAGAPDLFGAATPQLEAPAFAERDITPRAPTPELETDQILQARRTADAEYDQAFQDLVKAEQLGASDAELMEYQQALEDAKQARAELDAELEAVQRRIEAGRKQQTAEKRRAILDGILSDPETANPAARFTAELQRQGFTQIVPDADEMATIQRFEDAREAMATLPAEAAPVQQARPVQAAQPVQTDGNARQDGIAKPRLTIDQVKQAVTAGASLDGNVLRAPGAEPIALQGPMLAAAREAVRRREAGPALKPVAQGVRDAVESGGLARPNVVSQPQQGGVTNDVPTAESVVQEKEEAGGQEGAATGEGTGIGAVAEQPTQAPDSRITRDTPINDGETVVDAQGNPYRVHYQRNDLVVAHPIVDGKPQVSADTTVRFWTNPNVPPSGDEDRTDPIFVQQQPTQAPTAPEQSRPEPGQRSEPAQPDADAAADTPVGEGDTFQWNARTYQLTKMPEGEGRGGAVEVTVWRDGTITTVNDTEYGFTRAQFEKATGRKLKAEGAALEQERRAAEPQPTGALRNAGAKVLPGPASSHGDASLDKPSFDRALADAVFFGDSGRAESVRVKGFDFIDREDQRVVLAQVRAALNDAEVFNAVVEAIPVDVMDMLIGTKRSSDVLLHDPSVLASRLSVSGDVPIPESVGRFIDSLAGLVERVSAKLVAEKTRLSGVGSLPSEGVSAKAASPKRGLDALSAAEVPSELSVDARGSSVEDNAAGVAGKGGDGHTNVSIGGQVDTVDTSPTDAQKEAGVYKKGHFKLHGLDISVENPRGSVRSGTAPDGAAWSVTMPSHYGYIRGTKGADKDHVDIFVGPNPDNGTYYVINQNKPNTYGTKKRFDEHKVAVGFASENEAVANYLLSFADDFGARVFGSVAGPYTADELKALIPALAEAKPIARKKADNGVTTRRIKVDDMPAVEVTLPSGNVYRMNRLTAGESMGLAGWHDMDRDQFSFLGDNQEQAIAALIEREAAAAQKSAEANAAPADYEARYRARRARIEAATTTEELDAIVAEEHNDGERHFEGTNLVEREARDAKSRLKRAEERRIKDEQDERALADGQWVEVFTTSLGSEANAQLKKLSSEDPAHEYKLREVNDRNDVNYFSLQKRRKTDIPADTAPTEAAQQQADAADIPEPKNWRTSYGAAQKYAEALGVNPRGEDGKYLKLPALVAAIEAKRGGATAANPSSDFPVSLDVKTFIATFPEFNEFGLSQVWMNEDGSIERTVSDYELDTAVLQRYTKSDFLNAYRDGRVRETAVEARRGAGSADVSLTDEGKAEVAEKPSRKWPNEGAHFHSGASAFRDGLPRVLPTYFKTDAGKNAKDWYRGWDAANLASNPTQSAPSEVDSESARKSEFPLPGGTDAKIAAARPAAPTPSALDAAATALSDKKRAAAEKLKRLLASRRGTLNSGVDPELMLAVAELGAISIAEGAVKFAQWARDLIRATRAVGIDDDQVKPFMKEAYGAIAANPEKYDLTDDQADSMDALREVRRADVDALIDDNEGEAVNEQDGDDSGDDGALAPVSPRELQDPEGGRSAREGSGGLRGPDADGNERAAEDAWNGRDGSLAGEPGAVLLEGSDGDGVEQVEISGEPRSLEDVAESVKNDPPASEPKPKFPARFGDNPGNYTITGADALGTGTPGERIRANLAAVRLVLELERENRYPTREEQATLAKYVGWGGLKNVFKGDNSTSKQEREAYAELKHILTPDQLFWMGQSVLNAHYTSPKVVGAMYRVLRHFGIEGGRFLEPTVGTGNFIGLMPADMAASAKWFASEIDPITSLIAKNLYPDAQILPATGFQDAEFAYGRMDVAIGNPPFGDERITDTNKKRAEISGFKIHNYVISKSAMHLRPGGIMSFVVTSRFLDTANPEAREYLAKNFKFIGAFRLPNDAFAENAGTEVTTDIVFLQRLRGEQRDGVTADDMPWLDTKGRLLNQDNETVTLNRYFAENPGMLLGKPSMQGTMYGSRSERGEFTLQPIPGMDFAEEIDRILENEWAPLKGIGKARPAEANEAAAAIVLNREDVPIGGYFREGERVVQRVDDDADGNVQFRELTPETPWTEKQTLGVTRLGRIKGMLTLREMAYDLMADERADAPAEILEAKRAELNRVYDKFVDDFGFLNDAANKALMDDDPRIEFGLEGDYTKAITPAAAKRLGQAPAPAAAQKSSLLKERVFYPKQEIDRAESPADGYAISLSEKGQLDLEYIAEITDMPVDAVIADLSAGDKPLIFKDPALGRWVQEDEYLSGDVKDKLKLARGAGLDANVRALEAVQPADVPLAEIHAEFGATWLPASVYEDFLRLLGYDAPRVAVLPKSGVVDVASVGSLGTSHFRADIENEDYTVAEVFSAVASRRQLVAYDGRGDTRVVNQQRTENLGRIRNKMIAIWSDWIKSDPERDALIERQYNALMNTTVERQYDGVTHLRTVGANPAVDLRNSQKISAWRMIQSPITLLDHVVGAGKAQPLDAKLLTPTGWKRMGDIQVGDMVIAADGTPTTVEAVFPQGEKEIFRVSFSDGSSTECCDEHLWLTQTYRERGYAQRAAKNGKEWACGNGKVRQLSEIRETLASDHRGAKNHSIPIVAPVQFDQQDVPLHPYLLGALIGDGGFTHRHVRITSNDTEIAERCAALLPDGVALSIVKQEGRCPSWAITGRGPGYKNPVLEALAELGLRGAQSHEKFIPNAYLFNSVEARIDLLRGLMDTDGSVSKRGTSSYFYTTSERLSRDVVALVQSLGGVVRVKTKRPTFSHNGEKKVGKTCYVLCIALPPEINPFALQRKAGAVIPKTSYRPARYIVAVDPVGKKEAQCIRVSHPDHLYVTDDYIVTHNTMALITGIMERRRLGLSKKPIVVVPNHLVGQWARDWIQLYPGANILAATEKDFKKSNRRRLFARIATGKFDAVIVGHSSFGFIPVSRESELEFVRGEVKHLEAALTEAEAAEGGKKGKGDSRRVRGIKNRIAKRMEKVRDLQDKPRDNVVTFEDMGIDYLAVDELHEFKNLEYATTLSNVAGMGSPEGAKKSFDLFMKMRLLQAAGGGIAGATGTPISNSMVEMYSLLRYLNPDALAARGMEQFDAWVKAFASIEPRDEYTAAGKIKQRTVLAAFNNLPELLQMYKQVADTVTMTDLKRIYAEQVRAENARLAGESRPKPEAFPVPNVAGGGRRLDIGEPTEEQVEFMDYLIARADILDKLKGKQRQEYAKTDNALWLMNDARKMSLDVRIINPTLPDNPNNKVNRAAKNIRAIYDKWDAERGTQLVFCDLSTPVKTAAKDANAFIRGAVKALGLDGDRAIEAAIEEKSYADKWAFLESRADLMLESGTLSDARREGIESFLEKVGDDELSALQVADSGFSVYDALKAKLIESGIPEREIAFIHDANTADQKRELFDLVNAGKVRVLIGSSAKMGAGTNVQKRIVALHHMDAPWRPSDIEQREGRAIRQGNLIAFDKDGHPIRKDFELEIIAYSTERTFDAQMWGVLSRKAAFLEQFRMGLRSIKEVGGDAASYAEFMAEATGDQIFRDKLNLERELVDIEAEDRSAKMKRSAAERLVDSADGKIFTAEAELKSAQRAAAADLSSVEFRGETYRNDIAEVIEAEVALYREELAAYEEQEQAYKVARKAWEDAAGTERGRAPTKPQSPEVPELSAERVEAKSEWARFVNDLTKRMSMQGEGEANYGLKTADGQTIFLRVFKGEKSDSVQVLIDDSMIAWGAPRSPGVASRLMPGRLAGELKQAAEGRKESLKRLRANIEQAKVTLEQVKPVDPQRIADLRARYEAVKTQVDQISERMAIERAQRRNRFISRDSKRFPLGIASVPASSASAQPAPAAQKAKPAPRFRFADGSVSAVYGVEDVAFDGLGDYTFYTIADGEDPNQTWYVIENGTGLSVGKGGTRAAAIKAFKDIIKNRGLGNVREVIQKANKIDDKDRRGAIKAAGGDSAPSVLRDSARQGVDFRPVSLETAAGVVAGVRRATQKRWDLDLHLAPTFDALPDEVKQDVQRNYGQDARPSGVTFGETVYVIADEHGSESDLEATILHEVKGHVGVRRFYGDNIVRDLNQLFLQIGGNAGIKKLANDRGIADLGRYAERLAKSPMSDDDRVRVMMEEVLAHIVEAPRFMDRVKAIIGKVRAMLRETGLVRLAEYGETDLLHILKQAEGKLGQRPDPRGPGGGIKSPAAPKLGEARARITETEALKKWFGGERVVNIAPNELEFRESEQNRTSEVAERFQGGDYNPIVVIVGDGDRAVILDGHNRASVAADRGHKIPAVAVTRREYDSLSDLGFDDIEIAYAALVRAGQEDAASDLDRQFSGAAVMRRGMEAWQELPDDPVHAFDPTNPSILASRKATEPSEALAESLLRYADSPGSFIYGNTPEMRSSELDDVARAFSDNAIEVRTVGRGDAITIGARSDAGISTMVMRKNADGTYSINATTANPLGAEGRNGMRLYQALFAYAANAGLSITPEQTLTPINRLRRTSAMLSAALRNGTTEFTAPHPDQGVTGWKAGDFAGNISALAEAEARMVASRIPAFDQLSINPSTGQVHAADPSVLAGTAGAQSGAAANQGDVPRGRGETAGRGDSIGAGVGGVPGRDGIERGRADQDGAGQDGARSADGRASGDGAARAGVAVGGAPGRQQGDRVVSDSALEDYLARLGAGRGGANGHGVGLTTLKRALITRALLDGEAGAVGAPGMLYRVAPTGAGLTPAQFRAALVDRFGEKGVATLEREGILNIGTSDTRGVAAWYDASEGRAYFDPSRMGSATDVIEAVLHEIGEHHGLRGMLGDRGWQTLRNRLAELAAEGDNEVAAAWAGVIDNYPEFERYAKDLQAAIESDRFVHEVLAKLGESAAGRKSSVWRDLLAAINRFLLKMGVGRQINKAEIADLVEGSLKRQMRGKGVKRSLWMTGEPVMARRGAERVTAAWTPDRLTGLLRQFAYGMDANRTKAYAAWISPEDFLGATAPASERDQLESERRPLDADALAAETQPIFLEVESTEDDEGTFRIVGHEGRHRMMALRDAGVRSVPVVLRLRDAKRDARAIDEPFFMAQRFGDGLKGARGFYASHAYPISYANEQALREDFGSAADVMFQRPFDTADYLRTSAGKRKVRDKLADLLSGKSAKTFNWWQRTVGSQYGKARADADFGRVYEKAHDFIDDVSEFARSASDKAMGILPHMDTVGDVVKGLNARRAWSDAKDYQAISDAIFTGTLEDKVWNAGELRNRFGLDDKQVALYKQFRDATDFSLETLASSEMARTARAEGMELADARMSMAEAETFYVGQVEPLVTAAREVIEGLRLKHRIEIEDAAGLSEAKRDALIARQARERMAAEGALAKVAKLRDSFTEKAEQIRALQGKGYAPLMRFGQYTVDVVRLDEDGKPAKDDDGEIDRPFFGMFESEAEAREAEKIMRDEYPGYTVSRGVASTESSELYQGLSPEAAEMFARLLGVDVNDAFQTYLRQALNNRSAMKRLIKRKGMAGFANDIPRVLSSFIASNARLASSNWHFGEMRKAAAAIPKHKGDVTDEAIKLMNYIQNPQEEAAAMRGFLFFNFLGGSLASAIVNTTQTFSTTLPYLNQFGAMKAAKAIGGAMALGGKAMASGLDVVKDKDLRAALKRAAEDGIIDPQEIHLLMAEARGSGASNVLGSVAGLINESWRTPAARVGRAAMGAWGSFFSMAEKYNRHVAFIAAWEVAKDMTPADFKRIGVADRFEFARRAVIETQFDYSKVSRPNWARGAIGATLFTFKTFLVNWIEFVSRLPSRERALALAVLFLMSGLSGAPGTDDLDDLVDTIGQKLGYNWNNESGRHAWLVDVLGKDGANFVEHGVSAFIPLDVSARLGMGNLIPGTGLLKDSTTTPSREIAEIFGPAGSVFMGAVDTFGNVGTGKDPLETLRPIMPKAINDFRQAYDIATSGEYRDYRGRKVVDADLGDAFIKAIGFHPNVVAEPKRVERMVQQSVALHRTRRAEINELWARGVVEKDAGKVERAREMLRDWNRKNPTTPIRMNPESVRARVRAMRSTSAERLVKASSKDMRGMVANEIAVKD